MHSAWNHGSVLTDGEQTGLPAYAAVCFQHSEQMFSSSRDASLFCLTLSLSFSSPLEFYFFFKQIKCWPITMNKVWKEDLVPGNENLLFCPCYSVLVFAPVRICCQK